MYLVKSFNNNIDRALRLVALVAAFLCVFAIPSFAAEDTQDIVVSAVTQSGATVNLDAPATMISDQYTLTLAITMPDGYTIDDTYSGSNVGVRWTINNTLKIGTLSYVVTPTTITYSFTRRDGQPALVDYLATPITSSVLTESGTGDLSEADVASILGLIAGYNQHITGSASDPYVYPVTVSVTAPTSYSRFLSFARSLFGVFFAFVQSIFAWFISPAVLPFFLVGVCLSLIVVGIFVAKSIFWGR